MSNVIELICPHCKDNMGVIDWIRDPDTGFLMFRCPHCHVCLGVQSYFLPDKPEVKLVAEIPENEIEKETFQIPDGTTVN